MSIAQIIYQQLGGNKFSVMTGSKNYLQADITETNPNAWLRMDLTKNKSKANRLKISLMPDDTYKMEFYSMRKKSWKQLALDGGDLFIIGNEQTIEDVYCDQLQEIFTTVTGLYTSL